MASLGFPRERVFIAVGLVAAFVFTVSWLQGRFDTTDVRRGIGIALAHRPDPRGASVFEALVARGEGDPRCDGEVVSGLFGDVRVSCTTPARPDVHYTFRVLLGGERPPKAESEAAQGLLGGAGAAGGRP